MKTNLVESSLHKISRTVVRLSSCAVIAIALTPNLSLAADGNDPAGFIGGAFGLSVPTAQNASARQIWGIQGGAKIGSELGVSAYYFTSNKDELQGTVTGPFGYDLYGVQFAYYFEGEAKGAYFGGRLGLSKVTQMIQSQSVSSAPYHFGLVGGYDYFFNSHFSLGGEAAFMSIGQADTQVAGGSVKTQAFNALNLVAAAKFWF